MEKKIILVSFILATLFVSCTKKIETIFETYNYKSSYKNKTEIITECNKHYNYVSDTVTLNIDNKNIFIVYEDYGSGSKIILIKIFQNVSNQNKEEWRLLLIRNTNTSRVAYKVDELNKRVIFFSKSGKELVSLPFNSLNLQYDMLEE